MLLFQEIPSVILAAILPALCTTTNFASSSGTQHKLPPTKDNKCELISTFSLLTQACLGMLCISCLIAKRYYEYPARRTWPVWCFDVLKQLIGAMGLHVCNVTLSMIKGGGKFTVFEEPAGDDNSGEDPCDWYFLNIVFDCTIGVFILYLIFEFVNKILQERLHLTQLETGQYGPDPGKPSWRAFFKQLAVYFGSLMLTKVVLFLIMEYFSAPLVWFTSHVLLIWLNEYPDEFEIFIVMFVVPIFMNCLQLILVDTIIQNQVLVKENLTFLHAHDKSNRREALLDAEGTDVQKDNNYGTFSV